MSNGLGRRVPTDFTHIDKFPLSALASIEIPKAVPVTLGINWYSAFDNPQKSNGYWFIGKDGNLGSIRGGHCVCLKPDAIQDPTAWWTWYDQGSEGACEGFGHSRMMSLLNRRKYNPRWLWDQAKLIDEWPDTNPGDDNGTSSRAACEVLRSKGHVRWAANQASLSYQARDTLQPIEADGISVYRWATTVDEVRTVLASPRHDTLQAVPLLNSWGRSYPHLVWLPYKALERLISENGEIALIADR